MLNEKIMAKLFLITLFLLLLAQKTWTVGLDYIGLEDEEENELSNDITTNPIHRKAGDALYHSKNRPYKESRKLFDSKKTVLSTEQPSAATTTVRPTLTVSRKHPLEVLLDYDYQYQYEKNTEDNNDQSNTNYPPRESLRIKTLKPKMQLAINVNMTHYTNYTENAEDGFLLEPVAEQVDLRNEEISDYTSLTTWYVPEKYPCWELPSVYGEIEKVKTNSEVFKVHSYVLTNVEVNDYHEEDLPFPSPDEWLSKFNKWCAMSPCFGDHTLCLFPFTDYSGICQPGYKVQVLSLGDQKALVNILNSMRNHVAKGSPNQYPYLPPASNMKQVLYDYDLELMAVRWLHQCLPGPAPCLSLDYQYVSQLECTKSFKKCCRDGENLISQCQPEQECFINPVIGCLHTWYWSAGSSLDRVDVQCGHIEKWSYTLAQILWAETNKIGCAYGGADGGDIRVVCNFSPGAPFSLNTKYFCGFILLQDQYTEFSEHTAHVDLEPVVPIVLNTTSATFTGTVKPEYQESFTKPWGVWSLKNTYKEGWIRNKLGSSQNGTIGMMARLVTRYEFHEETNARCDTNEPVYQTGTPGAMCAETGRKFYALCYEFRDPTPGYRLVAILASIALFSLILYDLFSGVMRQLHIN